jgi:hypothetical protein
MQIGPILKSFSMIRILEENLTLNLYSASLAASGTKDILQEILESWKTS